MNNLNPMSQGPEYTCPWSVGRMTSCCFHFLLRPWVSSQETIYSNKWEVSDITFESSSNPNKTHTITWHKCTVTKKHYELQSAAELAVKCFLITFVTPIFVGIKTLWKVIYYCFSLLYGWYRAIALNLDKGIKAPFYVAKDLLIVSRDQTLDFIKGVLQLYLYSIGIIFASVGGWVIDPYQARQQISHMERIIIGQDPLTNDIRFRCHKLKASLSLKEKIQIIFNPLPSMYIAPCFHSLHLELNGDGFFFYGKKVREVAEPKEPNKMPSPYDPICPLCLPATTPSAAQKA